MISRIMAAIPRATGTKMMSHVGLSTQFDYTSQNYVPKKDLQQPPLQKLGSAHPFVSTMFLFIFSKRKVNSLFNKEFWFKNNYFLYRNQVKR